LTGEARPLALVTGGARRLGAAMSRELVRRGYDLWLHYHQSRDEAEALAAAFRQKGAMVQTVGADLGSPGGAEALAETLAARPPVLIIHSASEWLTDGWRSARREDWERSHRLHGWTALVLARLLVPGPNAQLITLLDARSRDRDPVHLSYGFAKRELLQLTRWLALELAPGVRVNGLAPGLVLRPDGMTPAAWKSLAAASPLERTGNPAQVVAALKYLLSSPGVTGQILTVDGGRHLKGDLFGSI